METRYVQKGGNGKSGSNTLITFIYLGYSLFALLVGLACVAIGAWYLADYKLKAYLTIFVMSKDDSSLIAAVGMMLTAGIILVILTVLSVVGIFLKKRFLTFLGTCLLIFVLLLGLVAGFLVVGVKYEIHVKVKNGMREQMQTYYDTDNYIGRAWNTVQVKKQCCGIDGSHDYENTDWVRGDHSVDTPQGQISLVVPRQCCVLLFNQEREQHRVNPQEPQPKDDRRCQEDAAGRKDGSDNLHAYGCFTGLMLHNDNLWYDTTIYQMMSVIMGLSLSIGFLQIIGIIMGNVYLRSTRRVK